MGIGEDTKASASAPSSGRLDLGHQVSPSHRPSLKADAPFSLDTKSKTGNPDLDGNYTVTHSVNPQGTKQRGAHRRRKTHHDLSEFRQRQLTSIVEEDVRGRSWSMGDVPSKP